MSLYEEARSKGQQVMMDTLLAVAERILTDEGPQALSMRRVASVAGCSTMVLYNLFGSKNGLVDALFQQGFRLLQTGVDSAPQIDDPVEQIFELCLIYRQVALAHPSHYRVMFGGGIPDYEPSDESRAHALASMGPLMYAVQRGIDAGRLHAPDAAALAMMVWSVAHGFVSLEMAGYYTIIPDVEGMYRETVLRVLG